MSPVVSTAPTDTAFIAFYRTAINRKNADTKKRDCDRCAIPLPIII